VNELRPPTFLRNVALTITIVYTIEMSKSSVQKSNLRHWLIEYGVVTIKRNCRR